MRARNVSTKTCYPIRDAQSDKHAIEQRPVMLNGGKKLNNTDTLALLSTANVNIFGKKGQNTRVRALLDTGSQCNFMTSATCKRLKIVPEKVEEKIQPLGESELMITHGKITVNINLGTGKTPHKITCLVADKITGDWPPLPLDLPKIRTVARHELADQNFDKPGPIDMLIGNCDFHYFQKPTRLCSNQGQFEHYNLNFSQTEIAALQNVSVI